MGEVHVAGGVDQVELIFLAIFRGVAQGDGVALDRNPAFPLNIHRIEHLIVELALGDSAAGLD
ncbi:hypothetical protein RSSM_06049 [Rhodopirellula sallentina SM41]|uniref:Uncharacterized protein n=1 Tax=Rhodopirellula sallentina SM41 TaxID=1263870 RepID=M5TTW2_9BACT|nr:hypothetical protein RSSM_06049 [Rhodopirellula sallentina SM41]